MPSSRVGSTLASSLAHVLLLGLALFIARVPPRTMVAPAKQVFADDTLVWVAHAGKPRGGGGGGGPRQVSRPRVVEVPGVDRQNVPVTQPPTLDVARVVDIEQIEAPVLAALNLAAAAELHPGVIEDTAIRSADAAGFGTPGGVGTGDGDGNGDGRGSGLGRGEVRGAGDGPFELGNGVTAPRLLHSRAPSYTSEAMRARIEGRTLLECVVLSDGTIGSVRVLRSLDRRYGLDDEAIRAARAWRFHPGTRNGRPVAVRITIEMSFTVH
jgi:protein TonB